jgi:hypothetical protein
MNWEKVFGSKRDPRSYGEYVVRQAPDRRHAVVFDPGMEWRMGCCEHSFRLIDSKKSVVEPFQELSTPIQRAWWTPDSRIVGVSVMARVDAMLFFHLQRREYALLQCSAYMLRARLDSRGVRVDMDPSQFRGIFGGTKFKPPRSMFFAFSSLRWRPAPAEWKLGPELRDLPYYKWLPPPSQELRSYARKHGLSLPPPRR